MEFIQRKSSKSPAPKSTTKKYKITPKNHQNTEHQKDIKYKIKQKKKDRWKPPYASNNHRHEDFKEERSYIHRTHGDGGDGVDDTSMSVLYRRRSINLHRHVLQKIDNIKQEKQTKKTNNNAFSTHLKLHSAVVPIHINPPSPILTFKNVSSQTMKDISSKMMTKRMKKKKSILIHKKPQEMQSIAIQNIPENISTATSGTSLGKSISFSPPSANEQNVSTQLDIKTIGFSPKITSVQTPDTPAMSSIPPLSAVNIDYIEMEPKINKLVEILIATEHKITDKKQVFDACDISENDLNESLFGWIDLLCTHPKLFDSTSCIKKVTQTNAFFAPPPDGDIGSPSVDAMDDEMSEREKEKEILRQENERKMENATDCFEANKVYHYTVFERLLFELGMHFLYFIYDIGLDNANAFSELHPSSLFVLSGNISQILRKCSPILNVDIHSFMQQILYPYHLKIRYKYLNTQSDASEWNIVDMIKYASDGMFNDYNFVARIQYEQMYKNETKIKFIDIDADDILDDDAFDEGLEYELIVYTNENRKGFVIYKSVIPSVFSINSELNIKNLKRTISTPSLIFKTQCHVQCEKWNEEGDYYGFLRIKCVKNMVINKQTTITASECGYFNQKGFGVGSFKNDFKNKTKYYSGGGYGTPSQSPHDECPQGSAYGDDCMKCNVLYYGSPSFDDGERGGGIVDIFVGEDFINYGSVTCNGSDGMQFGGSSGGSIKIVADNFVNFGNINADGGKGAEYQRKGSKRKQIGTKGGDGRIFVICNNFINKGTISPAPVVIQLNNVKEMEKYELSHIKSLSETMMFCVFVIWIVLVMILEKVEQDRFD